MIYEAKLVFDGKAAHGESSWWEDKKGIAIYLDWAGAKLFSFNPRTD